MKNLLYFEYKKNRTIPTILLIIVILFVVTNLVVFLASQQSSVVSVSFALDQVNYQEAGEQAEQEYQSNPTCESFYKYVYFSELADIQKLYEESSHKGEDYIYYLNFDLSTIIAQGSQRIESNCSSSGQEVYPFVGQEERLQKIREVFMGDYTDFIEYMEFDQNEKLNDETITQTKRSFYEKNLDLLEQLRGQELQDFQKIMLPTLILAEPSETFAVSEEQFNQDIAMMDQFGSYDAYLNSLDDSVETAREQREIKKYQLLNAIEPSVNESFLYNEKNVYGKLLDYLPILFIINTLLVIGAFAANTIIDHKKGRDTVLLTKSYSRSKIMASKLLYTGMILLVTTFYLLVSLLASMYLQGYNPEFIYTFYQNGGVVTYNLITVWAMNAVMYFLLGLISISVFYLIASLSKSMFLSLLLSLLVTVIPTILSLTVFKVLFHNIFYIDLVLLVVGVLLLILSCIVFQRSWSK